MRARESSAESAVPAILPLFPAVTTASDRCVLSRPECTSSRIASSFASYDARASVRRECITPSVKNETAVASVDVKNTRRRETIGYSTFGGERALTDSNRPDLQLCPSAFECKRHARSIPDSLFAWKALRPDCLRVRANAHSLAMRLCRVEHSPAVAGH